ncbi:MAG: hypothetical protein ABJA67_09735, partial [Chthonomonadales bacterium]
MELQNSQPEEIVVTKTEPSKLRIQKDKKGRNVSEITREEAIANLKAAGEKRKRRTKVRNVLIGVYIAFISIYLLVYLYTSISTGHWSKFTSPWFNLINILNLLGATGAMSFEQKETAKALAELGDIESVGVLIEVWKPHARGGEDLERNTLIEQALEKLLPQLNVSNKNLMEPRHFDILCQIWTQRVNKLTSPIILCMGEIGGEECIKPLEKYIMNVANNAQETANRVAATEALEMVKARV